MDGDGTRGRRVLRQPNYSQTDDFPPRFGDGYGARGGILAHDPAYGALSRGGGSRAYHSSGIPAAAAHAAGPARHGNTGVRCRRLGRDRATRGDGGARCRVGRHRRLLAGPRLRVRYRHQQLRGGTRGCGGRRRFQRRACAFAASTAHVSPVARGPFALASRGALIGEVAALALLFFLERKGGVAAALKPLAALLAGTVLVFVAAEQQWFWFRRFTQPGVNTDYTSGRTDLWSFAVDQWETSLIFGLGPGGGTSDMLARTAIAYPHNFVLAWLIQVGLVGTLVLMVVLCPRPLRRWTVAAAPLVAITIHSMIEPMIETPVGAVFFAVLLAAHGIPSRSQSKDVTS
ncbi:O-antigen ligase family protein [Nocardioides daphniae]|uniref:O-antigen ligase family protein n=1 Tax=Nocardioides daphniae TaxID=402297 RepID=UPI0023AF6321|nr:O-antigen ligase family protein [Nocardioides daphniae]